MLNSFYSLSRASVWGLLMVCACVQTALAQNSVASQETTVTGGTLMLVAYIVLWVLISGTIFAILKHQRALTQEMDALRQRMDQVLGVDD